MNYVAWTETCRWIGRYFVILEPSIQIHTLLNGAKLGDDQSRDSKKSQISLRKRMAIRVYQAAVNITKSPQREAAESRSAEIYQG